MSFGAWSLLSENMSGSENHDGHTSKRTCFFGTSHVPWISWGSWRESQNALDLTWLPAITMAFHMPYALLTWYVFIFFHMSWVLTLEEPAALCMLHHAAITFSPGFLYLNPMQLAGMHCGHAITDWIPASRKGNIWCNDFLDGEEADRPWGYSSYRLWCHWHLWFPQPQYIYIYISPGV